MSTDSPVAIIRAAADRMAQSDNEFLAAVAGLLREATLPGDGPRWWENPVAVQAGEVARRYLEGAEQ